MKKLILATCLATALSACGGDGKKSENPDIVDPTPPIIEEPVEETREETIERELNLPPEPDKAENNSTILGIDVNENNIRDDVERYIAFKYYDDKPLMKMHFENARQWTEAIRTTLTTSEETTLDTYLEMANTGLVWTRCLIRHHNGDTSKSREEILDADLALLTTPERLLAVTEFESHLSGQFFSSIPDDIIEQECSKYYE